MEFDKKRLEEEARKNLPKVRGNLVKGDKVIPLTSENVKIVVTRASLEGEE